MEYTDIYFLDLLRNGSIGHPSPPPTSPVDWEKLLKLAARHNSIAIVAVSFPREFGSADRPSEDLVSALKARALEKLLIQLASYKSLTNIITRFTQAGIPAVVFKGIVIDSLYFTFGSRSTCDSDILVSPAHLEQAMRILEQEGFTYQKSEDLGLVKCYVSPALSIDLHSALWGDMIRKHRDALTNQNFEALENCIDLNIHGITIKTFTPENQFLYLFVHYAKHFVAKGASIRNLMDISLFYNKYHDKIDAQNIWAAIKRLEFESFFSYSLELCRRYLGMTDGPLIADINIDINEKTLESLLRDLIGDSTSIQSTERAISHNVVKESYYAGIKHKGRAALTWKMIFPRAMVLPSKYMYAKKHKILLPLAWIHRFFSFIHNRLTNNSSYQYLVSGSVESAETRISLMFDLDLLD